MVGTLIWTNDWHAIWGLYPLFCHDKRTLGFDWLGHSDDLTPQISTDKPFVNEYLSEWHNQKWTSLADSELFFFHAAFVMERL